MSVRFGVYDNEGLAHSRNEYKLCSWGGGWDKRHMALGKKVYWQFRLKSHLQKLSQLPRLDSLGASPLTSFTLHCRTHLEHLPHSPCVGNQIQMLTELRGESLKYLGQDEVMRVGPSWWHQHHEKQERLHLAHGLCLATWCPPPCHNVPKVPPVRATSSGSQPSELCAK